ncbi:FHA domain-containing protein [Bifidobacterium sp. LC6]|uniref:FHA domain-containing protein n=1 Tax=Bifidobacterium colobi TaxID=2809026 RepID=A0ABS5UTX8_9BIFI|nr:FHA domain-containing protein [Bifidobacterium colobi]MBT1174519.1 FHA domain-containing protein [Bifidobacterium colobi]
MRAKLVKDRRNGAQTMTVHATRGESLDVRQAQWLAQGHWYMLPFRYESNEAETLLYYDVTNCVPLHKHLHQALPAGQFTGALLAVLSVMEQCDSQHMPLDYIDWDAKQIFMAPQGYPLFMVTPLVGIASNRDTQATLLKLLADTRKTKVTDAAEQNQQVKLYGFLQQTPVVSPAVFHDFLAMALPGMVQPRAVGTQPAAQSAATDSAQRVTDQPANDRPANSQAQGAAYDARNAEEPMSETQFGQTVVAGTAQFDAIRSAASGVANGAANGTVNGAVNSAANGTAATDDATQLGARNDATLINGDQSIDNRSTDGTSIDDHQPSPQPIQQSGLQPIQQPSPQPIAEDDEDGGTVLSTLLKRRTDAHSSPATPLPQRVETRKPQPQSVEQPLPAQPVQSEPEPLQTKPQASPQTEPVLPKPLHTEPVQSETIANPEPVAQPEPMQQPLRPQPQLAQQSQPIEQSAMQSVAQPVAQSQPIMASQSSQPIQEPVAQQTQAQPIQQTQPAVDLPEDSEGETILRPSASKVSGFTVTRLRDGKTITVYAEHATIGRSKTADIHMGGNTNVSRVHAIIDVLDDGRFSITDNHSANGTAVEGRELADGGCEYLPSGGDFTLADDTFVVKLLHR